MAPRGIQVLPRLEEDSSGGGLSDGAISGIVIGVIILSGSIFTILRSVLITRSKEKAIEREIQQRIERGEIIEVTKAKDAGNNKPTHDNESTGLMRSASPRLAEMPNGTERQELENFSAPQELAHTSRPQELEPVVARQELEA
ncbi:hypothetical protein F5Y03DRAFT_396294 [Xylaria venustula]|nr:hypothetical protein F5Y03DRAFT_396294 [Xylaria venustula]